MKSGQHTLLTHQDEGSITQIDLPTLVANPTRIWMRASIDAAKGELNDNVESEH